MPWFENRLGEQLWYEESGCGISLLFLHGWCMSSAVWQGQFGGLDNGSFRLIAPDLRGHGHSRCVSGQFEFERFAADLSDLVKFLDLARVILIGWSMGAQIAIQAYQDLADRLVGLVLVSATPSFTAKEGYPFGLTSNEASGMRLKVQRNIDRALNGFHARMFADGELESFQLADQVTGLLTSVIPPETDVALAALDALVEADMRSLLAEIRIPTLVMNGDRDQICLPQASDYLVEHIELVRHTVFPGCGHAPFMTRSEQFNCEITSYAGSVCDRIA